MAQEENTGILKFASESPWMSWGKPIGDSKDFARKRSDGATGGTIKALDEYIKALSQDKRPEGLPAQVKRIDKTTASLAKSYDRLNRTTVNLSKNIEGLTRSTDNIGRDVKRAIGSIADINQNFIELENNLDNKFNDIEESLAVTRAQIGKIKESGSKNKDKDEKTIDDLIDDLIDNMFGLGKGRGNKPAKRVARPPAGSAKGGGIARAFKTVGQVTGKLSGPIALGAAAYELSEMRGKTEDIFGDAYEKGDLNKIKNQAIREGLTGITATDAELIEIADKPDVANEILTSAKSDDQNVKNSAERDISRYGRENLEKIAAGEKLTVEQMRAAGPKEAQSVIKVKENIERTAGENVEKLRESRGEKTTAKVDKSNISPVIQASANTQATPIPQPTPSIIKNYPDQAYKALSKSIELVARNTSNNDTKKNNQSVPVPLVTEAQTSLPRIKATDVATPSVQTTQSAGIKTPNIIQSKTEDQDRVTLSIGNILPQLMSMSGARAGLMVGMILGSRWITGLVKELTDVISEKFGRVRSRQQIEEVESQAIKTSMGGGDATSVNKDDATGKATKNAAEEIEKLATSVSRMAGGDRAPGGGLRFDNYDTSNIKGLGETGSATEAMTFLMSKGWTQEQAAGIVGNLQAESGANMKTDAIGDNGRAYGIAQWHPDRQNNFKRVYGKDIRQAGFKEQLEFLNWELNNTERAAGDALRSTKTAREAAIIFDAKYERSSGAHRPARIANAEAIMKNRGDKSAESTASAAAGGGGGANASADAAAGVDGTQPGGDATAMGGSPAMSPIPVGGTGVGGPMSTPPGEGNFAEGGAGVSATASQGKEGGTTEAAGTKAAANLNFAPGVDPHINTGIAQKISQIESAFGTKLTVSSGFRDPQRNAQAGGAKNSAHMRANATDITFPGDAQQTLKLVEVASKAGIGGIGVYRPGVVHLDTESKRVWGPDFTPNSIPPWASQALNAHMSGQWGQYDPSAAGSAPGGRGFVGGGSVLPPNASPGGRPNIFQTTQTQMPGMPQGINIGGMLGGILGEGQPRSQTVGPMPGAQQGQNGLGGLLSMIGGIVNMATGKNITGTSVGGTSGILGGMGLPQIGNIGGIIGTLAGMTGISIPTSRGSNMTESFMPTSMTGTYRSPPPGPIGGMGGGGSDLSGLIGMVGALAQSITGMQSSQIAQASNMGAMIGNIGNMISNQGTRAPNSTFPTDRYQNNNVPPGMPSSNILRDLFDLNIAPGHNPAGYMFGR